MVLASPPLFLAGHSCTDSQFEAQGSLKQGSPGSPGAQGGKLSAPAGARLQPAAGTAGAAREPGHPPLQAARSSPWRREALHLGLCPQRLWGWVCAKYF